MNLSIAIDGPAGSGKSSVSREVSKKTDYNHLDTGAMYRAITFYAQSNNISLEDESKYDFLNNINIEFINAEIHINGVNVSKEIRTPEVTKNTSQVASLKVVRDKLKDLQREIASSGKYILDGRDIGTNVLTDAKLKIFLTATSKVRAKRRYDENIKRGIETNLEDLEADIIKRDKLDSEREYAPLMVASDAVLIDTSELSFDEVVDAVIDLINRTF